MGLLLVAIASSGVASVVAATAQPIEPIATYERVELVRVVDADTLRLRIQIAPGVAVSSQSCRLLGVDAPEKPTPEGKAAAARVAEFLQGKKLRVTVYGADRAGRWLVKVEAGGVDLGQWLVDEKLAVAAPARVPRP